MKVALTREYLGRDSDDGTSMPKMVYGHEVDGLQSTDCDVYHRNRFDADTDGDKRFMIRTDGAIAALESMVVWWYRTFLDKWVVVSMRCNTKVADSEFRHPD